MRTSAVDLRCRFGGVTEVPASFAEGGRSLACVTPNMASMAVLADAGFVPLHVTTNGQDYSGETVVFRPYVPPSLSSLSVTVGPTGGDTSITLYGSNLRAGDDCRCRFGSFGDTVPGTIADVRGVAIAGEGSGGGDYGRHVVRCVSPAHAEGTVALEVTFNGQDYTAVGLSFTFYPPPFIASLSPSAAHPRRDERRHQWRRAPEPDGTLLASVSGGHQLVPATLLEPYAAAASSALCRPRGRRASSLRSSSTLAMRGPPSIATATAAARMAATRFTAALSRPMAC